MEIKEFLKAKNDMEDEIMQAVAKALDTFEKTTGHSPKYISVGLYEVHEIGKERPTSYVREVKASMDL